MKKLILLLALTVLGSCQYAFGQTAEEPKVCISQEAANKCAANARTVTAQDAEIAALKAAIAERDKSIEELKETNRKNVAELTERVHASEIKLAETAGELVGAKATIVDQRAIITVLLPMVRQKTNGIKIF